MAVTAADPLASAALGQIGFTEEIQPGVTPTGARLQRFRHTGGGISLEKDVYVSGEMDPTRMQGDSRHGTRRATGSVETELSVGSYDAAFEALMGGVWKPGDVFVGGGSDFVSLAANGTTRRFVVDSPAVPLGIRFGDRVQISGAGSNDGKYTVTEATETEFAVAEDIVTAAADSGAEVSIARMGRRLTIGNIYRSFSWENALGGVSSYQVFRGVKHNSMALQMPPTGMAKATWGLIGQFAGGMNTESIDGRSEVSRSQADFGQITLSATDRTIVGAVGDFTVDFAVDDVITFPSGVPTALLDKRLTLVAVEANKLTVGESIPAGVVATWGMVRKSTPAYLEPTLSAPVAAAEGVFVVDGEPVGTVTGFNLTLDNGIGGPAVVGSNTLPQLLWGDKQTATGSLTVLFQEGGVYNKFEQEVTGSIIVRMDDPLDGFIQLAMPRVKFNSGGLGSPVTGGIPITMNFELLKPTRDDVERTHIVVISS